MKRYILILLLLFQCFTSNSQTPQEVKISFTKEDVLKHLIVEIRGSVTDLESLFNESQACQLDSLIQEFERRTTIPIAVVTLNENHCDKSVFEDYTLKLANNWSIGKKGEDKGVLIGISKQFRQMRIQNSNVIEKMISDEATKKLIDDHFIPKFKENNYFEATKAGLLALMQTLENKKKLQTKAQDFTSDLIALIEHKEITKLTQKIAENLYCGMCYPSAKSPNGISRKLFLKKYLNEVFDQELLRRLQRDETQFFANSTDYGDCVIFYTTHRKDENGDNHEGAQFGFWLTEENGKLQLSGLETVP